MIRALACAALALFASALDSPAARQNDSCSHEQDGSEAVREIRDLASEDGADSLRHAQRIWDSLPSVAARQVRVIKDKAVCPRALDAMNRANRDSVASGGDGWIAKSVTVIRVGDVYVVTDPMELAGEYRLMSVYDTAFTRLKTRFTL